MNNPIQGLPGLGTPLGEARNAVATSNRAATDSTQSSPSGSGGDRVDLTESARAIRDSEQVQGNAPAVDAGRVEAIRQEIAEGRYSVSAERIADRLLGLEQQLGGAA